MAYRISIDGGKHTDLIRHFLSLLNTFISLINTYKVMNHVLFT
jgi:hypothetical protein